MADVSGGHGRNVGGRQQHASVPLRRVRAGELREEFLYELKAGLRVAASGGRPRPLHRIASGVLSSICGKDKRALRHETW